MPYADVVKQRAYDRLWKRDKRAKSKAADVSPERVVERIAALEKELAMLKAEVSPGLNLNIDVEPTPQELREARIKAFSARLYADRPGSIATRQAELNDLEAEFDSIVKEGPEFADRVEFLKALGRERVAINEREERAQWLEQEIAGWSKGGAKRGGLEKLLAEDHLKGKRMINDPDPQVRHLETH